MPSIHPKICYWCSRVQQSGKLTSLAASKNQERAEVALVMVSSVVNVYTEVHMYGANTNQTHYSRSKLDASKWQILTISPPEKLIERLKKYSTTPGLEPGISWSVVRRLIHWATRPTQQLLRYHHHKSTATVLLRYHQTTTGQTSPVIWRTHSRVWLVTYRSTHTRAVILKCAM